ncbi:endophilin-A1-like isoform X2 [Acanthaster planci]|uniref:Endophilin-A1-like isoform X2 n=1 Tax=Acanthaster planci TaxID=133434 RepID=A0A8B7ZLV5_ACAPL|nr:endophilin-A1-like isoform X2 [Acanthaster planci]
MSFRALKKQYTKANQYMSERIGGAEKTKPNEDFVEMERKIDVTGHALDDLMGKTTEYLQPNPVSRAMSKVRGKDKGGNKPLQPVGFLGEVMLKNGRDLGEDSSFGVAMVDMGESLRQLSEIKDAFDLNVRQNFLDPLDHLKNKDLKEINHHRKKMEGRRLDYDYKKKKQAKAGGSTISEEEIKFAEEKFNESQELAYNGMRNLLDSDVEQVLQLQALAEAQLEYHKQSADILENLLSTLNDRVREAENKPKSERRLVYTTNSYSTKRDSSDADDTDAYPPVTTAATKEQCRALYDFEAENDGELGFQEGDIIDVISKIDENWIDGELNGRTGYFPANYVEMI